MKKTFTTSILVAALTMTAMTATAKSWRINSDVTKKADFTSINAAMSSDDVIVGDTLYLDPGCLLTANQTVSKRVIIVGPGYLRSNAPHQTATISGSLYLDASNVKIEGVTFTADVFIRAQNITIERCRATANIRHAGNSSYNAQYATIRQCYLTRVYGYSKTSTVSAYWTIENNIILYTSSGSSIFNLDNPTIKNNYITNSNNNYTVLSDIQGGMITNNIIIHKGGNNNIFGSVSEANINNNVLSCAGGTYSTIGDNKYLDSNDESLVFALEGTYDQQYQLKTDSPAKGYATDGGDCGPFGGTYPYVLSGLPAGYPYYTKANIATRAKDGKINVSLNIKMQNE